MAKKVAQKLVEASAEVVESVSSTDMFDWLVSIALVVTIVALAFWVCNNPERDSTDSEGFWNTKTHETFNSPSVVKVVSENQLDEECGDNDIGCCLVYYEGCGHCKHYKPTWKSICDNVNGTEVSGKTIKMYECGDDGDQNVWRTVSDRHSIRGYPTILVKIGGRGANWQEYTGPRDKLGDYLKSL